MMIQRNADVLSGASDLELLHRFERFPAFMGCVSTPAEQDVRADMAFHISRTSGMVQLHPLLPLEVLYPAAHGAGCVGASWEKHHSQFARFIARFAPDSVLELGGGHGILSMRYDALHAVPWTILEPNPTPAPGCQARVIKGFFDRHFRLDVPVDAVVHSHVFEHIYDPRDFLQSLKNFIQPGKWLIFSVPHMRVMLERKFTNCLNFEHTVYLTDYYIEYLLAQHGFRLEAREYFGEDHSIFYAAVRDEAVPPLALGVDWYQHNRTLFLDYIAFHQQLISDINLRLQSLPDADIFLFGAHVQSQYLIGFGLDISRFKAVLDNDRNKTGLRLSGTPLTVQLPEILADCSVPIVIIRAGTFASEVKAQIRRINPATEFIE